MAGLKEVLMPQRLAERRLLTNCRLLNLNSGATDLVSIAIHGDRVNEIYVGASPSGVGDYLVTDMRGRYTMPGLIDLHQHICADSDPASENNLGIGDTRQGSLRIAESNLSQALSGGVTTIRDVGTYQARGLEVRREVSTNSIPGPNIVSCGKLITYPAGHGAALGVEVRGAEQAGREVARNIAAGADFIKIASDPEDLEARSNHPNSAFTVDELRAITAEAHAEGKKVACHTFPSPEGVKRALESGVDTLEHAVPFDNETIQKMLDGGTAIVPTVVAAADEFLPSEIEQLLDISADTWRRLADSNYPPEQLRNGNPAAPPDIVTWMNRLIRHLPAAISAGVRIGIGTDAGCRGTNFRSAVREMFLLVAMGASHLEVLRYATCQGAAALGLVDVGVLRKGALADIVFLAANPIVDLHSLLEPAAVMSRGGWVA